MSKLTKCAVPFRQNMIDIKKDLPSPNLFLTNKMK